MLLILTTFCWSALACLEYNAGMSKDLELEIDTMVNSYLGVYDIPGVVVLVGHRDSISLHKAYGAIDGKMKMQKDAIFDLASITKVFTASALLKDLESRNLSHHDKVSTVLASYSRAQTKKLTFEDLLRHQSGMQPSVRSSFYELDQNKAWESILAINPKSKPASFVYSDVNYLVLGKALETLQGQGLDKAISKLILRPLGMDSSGFRPMDNLVECQQKCAPTGGDKALGEVHDPTSRHLGGIGGHAGLFASATDLAKFASMFLNEGQFCSKEILSESIVRSMTVKVPYSDRGLGFDITSKYSEKPSGEYFSRGISFGHTGYTGTSMWIDPTLDTYLIVLSNPVHAVNWKRAKKGYLKLIRELATSVGRANSY